GTARVKGWGCVVICTYAVGWAKGRRPVPTRPPCYKERVGTRGFAPLSPPYAASLIDETVLQKNRCPPAVAGGRRRFLRPSRLSRAAEVDPRPRREAGGRDPRLRQHAAAALARRAAARRRGRLGYLRGADLSARSIRRLSERARVRR